MKYLGFFALLFTLSLYTKTPLYFCTAADAGYFDRLIHLIASIHATNYDNLDTIAVFDLGLHSNQIKKLKHIKKVVVLELEQNNPAIKKPFRSDKINILKKAPGWYAFKDVALEQALDLFPYVLWIDAGTLVLHPLDHLFKHIDQAGYFFCTVGGSVLESGTTKHVRNTFKLDAPEHTWMLGAEMVMGGVFGIKKGSIAYEKILVPMYQMAQDPELSFYRDDGTTPDGFGTGRHDQPLRSILAYQAGLTVFIQDPTQKVPIMLDVNGQQTPFYITWDKNKVNNKTDIFSSRGHFDKYHHFLKSIRYTS